MAAGHAAVRYSACCTPGDTWRGPSNPDPDLNPEPNSDPNRDPNPNLDPNQVARALRRAGVQLHLASRFRKHRVQVTLP